MPPPSNAFPSPALTCPVLSCSSLPCPAAQLIRRLSPLPYRRASGLSPPYAQARTSACASQPGLNNHNRARGDDMAYDGFHPGSLLVYPVCLPRLPYLLTPSTTRQPERPLHLAPPTWHLALPTLACACAWACARRTLVQAKVDTLHFPFCYSTVPARYDGIHSLNLKPRGLSIHRC